MPADIETIVGPEICWAKERYAPCMLLHFRYVWKGSGLGGYFSNSPTSQCIGYDYMAYMDYMDLVHCPQKGC